MRFDASPPVCYVRLYRLCSLVSSPVFNHIFAFLSVLLCPPLSSRSRPSPSPCPAICPHLPVPPSVPISLSRHLSPSPCLFPAILLSAQPQHPIPSAHNPYIRSHWAVHFGRNRAIDYPSGRNRGRIRPFRPPNHGFRPNEPHSRATHPRIRSPTRLVLGQGKRLDCANG